MTTSRATHGPARPPRLIFSPVASVRGRIIASFALLIIITLLGAAVSAWQAREHRSELAEMETAAATVSFLQQTESDAVFAVALLEIYVSTGDEKLIPEIRSNLAAAKESLSVAKSNEQALGHEEQVAAFGQFQTALGIASGMVEQAITLRQGGDVQGAVTTVALAAPGLLPAKLEFDKFTGEERQDLAAFRGDANRTAGIAFWFAVLGGAAGGALGIAASFFIARSILRPLSRLESAALAVAGGDLSARARVTGPQEVARLGASFNQMTEALLDASKRRELQEERNRAYVQLEQVHGRLRQSERRWRSMIQNTQDIITVLSPSGVVIYCSPSVERVLGYTQDYMNGKSAADLVHPDDVADLGKEFALLAQEPGTPRWTEFRYKHADGSWRTLSAVGSYVPRTNGEATIIVNSRDITARREAEQALEEANRRLEEVSARLNGILESIEDVVYAVKPGTFDVLFLNPAIERVYGRPLPEFFSDTTLWMDVIHPEDIAGPIKSLEMMMSGTGEFDVEYRIFRPDGEIRWLHGRAWLVRDSAGNPLRIDGINTDITERKQSEETIRHMAYHDALTGLPNRALFEDRFSVALAQAKRTGSPIGVMSVDADRFKVINDTLGHAAGDEMLKAVANRLSTTLREGDTVARMGGDEFMLLLGGSITVDGMAAVARNILNALKSPFRIEERPVHATVSIGISLYPQDGDEMETLIQNADAAMYRAKEMGRNNYQMYTPAMNVSGEERLTLEADLRGAIDRAEFQVYYQPQIDMNSGRMAAVEALVRWHKPGQGIVLPGVFIGVAEETGLIIELGEWVLRESCAQVKAWLEAGLPPVRVAVNISMRQFQQPDFVEMVARVLADTSFPAHLLELEITETTAMKHAEYTIHVLRDLKEMGIRLSIDDFGTGYSSLGYLRDFPIHALKIDRSFILEIPQASDSAAIAENVVGLGHNLNLEVVAEGVENEEQLLFLRSIGCDLFQGYLCQAPMPAEAMEQLMRSAKPICGALAAAQKRSLVKEGPQRRQGGHRQAAGRTLT